jgi:hypothetical protein
MSITVDTGNLTTNQSSANQASPWSFNHTCGANVDYLVVGIIIFDSSDTEGAVSGVKYNSIDMTELHSRNQIGAVIDCSLWLFGLEDPGTGNSYSVSVTMGGKCTDIAGFAIGIEGTVGTYEVDATPAYNLIENADGPYVTFTPGVSDTIALFVGGSNQGTASKLTVKSGQTSLCDIDAGNDWMLGSYVIYSSGGSKTVGWDDADADEDNLGLCITLKEAADASQVNKDIQLLWDIAELVNKDTQLLWDINVLVNKDTQLLWDIFNLVNKDTQLLWDIANLVNKDIQLLWDMEGSVNKDIQLLYDILNLVNKDTQLVWDILNLVNKDTQLIWDIGNLVNKDIQLLWDMEGIVNKDMQLLWDIDNLVNKDIQAIYDIANLVGKDIQLIWDMTELVNKDTQLVWDILALANKDTQLVWDILESSGVVNKDVQLIWDIGGDQLLIATDGKTFFVT